MADGRPGTGLVCIVTIQLTGPSSSHTTYSAKGQERGGYKGYEKQSRHQQGEE